MNEFIANLDSYKEAVENAKGFQIEVYLRSGVCGGQSSALPIDMFEQALEDLENSHEQGNIKLWDRLNSVLSIVPIQEVAQVKIRFIKNQA